MKHSLGSSKLSTEASTTASNKDLGKITAAWESSVSSDARSMERLSELLAKVTSVVLF